MIYSDFLWIGLIIMSFLAAFSLASGISWQRAYYELKNYYIDSDSKKKKDVKEKLGGLGVINDEDYDE